MADPQRGPEERPIEGNRRLESDDPPEGNERAEWPEDGREEPAFGRPPPLEADGGRGQLGGPGDEPLALVDQQPEHDARQGHGKVALEAADLHELVHKETNPEMQKILKAAVARSNDPKEKSVSREWLLDYLRTEHRLMLRCKQFPFIVLYFLFFALTTLLHEDLGTTAQVERNAVNMLEGGGWEGYGPEYYVSGHKVLEDISSPTDIWTYLHQALLPLYLPDLTSTPANDLNRVLRYNQLIGGVQLQQIRRPKVDCAEENPTQGPKDANGDSPLLEGFSCFPWDNYADTCFGPGVAEPGFCPDSGPPDQATGRLLTAQSWAGALGRRLSAPQHAAKVKGQSWDAVVSGPLGSFEGGLYTQTLHEYEGLEVAINRTKRLQELHWIDDSTAWLGIKLFTLNPDLAVFSYAIVNVYFPPSGGLIPAVTIATFPAEPYQDMSVLVLDALWLLLWVHLLCRCWTGLVHSVFARSCKAYWKDFWHWMDWMTLLGGTVVFVMYVVFISLLSGVKQRVMEVAMDRPQGAAFESEAAETDYRDSTNRMHAAVALMAGYLNHYRTVICWYSLFVTLRFFQAFKAQPRLAIVTNTIQHSIADIAHFFIVLIIVLLSYATAGMFLFGHRMLEFSELGTAINYCFLVMLGSFDYDELAQEHPLSAAFWFWTYVSLVSLIMLNMALAIVLDVYSEVKADADGTDEIWTQSAKIITGLWTKRNWMTLHHVQEALEQAEEQPQCLTTSTLMRVVPKLHQDQAHDIIVSAARQEERKEDQGLSLTDAMKMVGGIKINVQKIAKQIEEIVELEHQEKELMLGVDAEGEPVHFGDAAGDFLSLDPNANRSLKSMMGRLANMEAFVSESMGHTVSRGKEMRNCLLSIEGLLGNAAGADQGYDSAHGEPFPLASHVFAPPGAAPPATGRTVSFNA